MTDIVKRLREGLYDLDYQTKLNPLLDDAADEIERLRQALHIIANDYVELSHDKVHWQRDDHMKIARKALEESYGYADKPIEPLSNDF